jgi:hypothetical protein
MSQRMERGRVAHAMIGLDPDLYVPHIVEQ